MKRKTIIFVLNLMLFNSCNLIVSGSYPYSEKYTFDFSTDKLINVIKTFKSQNPKYKTFKSYENGERGERKDELVGNNTFYGCWFYVPEYNMIFKCVINVRNSKYLSTSTIQLVGVAKSEELDDWKELNTKDLSIKENTAIKNIFESQILDKIGDWKHKSWW